MLRDLKFWCLLRPLDLRLVGKMERGHITTDAEREEMEKDKDRRQC